MVLQLSKSMHRFVGALSSKQCGGIYAGLERFAGRKDETYGRSYDTDSFLDTVSNCRLVFLGEIHSIPQIISLQMAVMEKMITCRREQQTMDVEDEDNNEKTNDDYSVSSNPPSNSSSSSGNSMVHLIMEHFAFDMQDILEDYQEKKITFEDMLDRYKAIGTEGHNLLPYRPLLEHARNNKDYVKLHAGFLSRKYARKLMKEESEESVLQAASKWLPNPMIMPQNSNTTTFLEGNDFHYNLFESMLSGRNMHYGDPPDKDRFRRIYKAQLLKDVAMAHKVNSIIQNSQNDNDGFLVIAGNGHVSNYQGVPERVLKEHPYLIDQCCLITSHAWDSSSESSTTEEGQQRKLLMDVVNSFILEELEAGPAGANPADYFYVYEEEEAKMDDVQKIEEYLSNAEHDNKDNNENDAIKKETIEAYDKVGNTAHIQGNSVKARAILTYLGYSEEQIRVAGDDAYNYQGIGNPHRNACIQKGEVVLDIGSGLGIDSFIAAHATGGPEGQGKVIGIDISHREVQHAQRRAKERGLTNNDTVRFLQADMEKVIPFEDDKFDVILSNGALCLAPNKAQAFREMFRVLKPGGRISIYTTTIQSEKLHKGVEWPICMKMFIPKDQLEPLCKKVGFTNIIIDESDSKMVYELPEESIQDVNPGRHRIHSNDNNDTGNNNNTTNEESNNKFNHLENYDMDELCARVCIVAHKPLTETTAHNNDTEKDEEKRGFQNEG